MLVRILRWAATFAVVAFMSGPTNAQPTPSQARWTDALRDGGFVIVFRHGATFQNQADTDPLNPQNISQQRQLNDEGRAQAKSIGASLRELHIPIGQVHTSLFKRAIDTAICMGLVAIMASPDYTEGGLVVTPIENNRRAAALRKIVATTPPPGTNVIVVTHKPNILDAFGKDWFDVRESEASVFKPDGNGGYKPVIRIEAGAWAALAQDAELVFNQYDRR